MTTKNIATILLMLGIVRTNSANVSLLNNFEIVATSLIALLIFKEMISYSLWFAIFMVTESILAVKWILAILFLGFVAYGLSIKFYIMAQRHLGAAKTSAYYSIAPFLGVAFSMALLSERPGLQFYAAMIIMIVATVLMGKA